MNASSCTKSLLARYLITVTYCRMRHNFALLSTILKKDVYYSYLFFFHYLLSFAILPFYSLILLGVLSRFY